MPEGRPQALRVLETLDSCWEELYVGINRYDCEIWPTREPVNRTVLFVADEHNNYTTYEYLPELRRARPMIDMDVSSSSRSPRPTGRDRGDRFGRR